MTILCKRSSSLNNVDRHEREAYSGSNLVISEACSPKGFTGHWKAVPYHRRCSMIVSCLNRARIDMLFRQASSRIFTDPKGQEEELTFACSVAA